MDSDLSANIRRFTGFADTYDAYRPSPPAVLADVICGMVGVERPALVVDLGCGTGSSTRYWAGRADRIVGVEPSADMRRQAESATGFPNVSFREGYSHATGLPDNAADIITCSQSLHWMLPEPTFVEAARVLRRGGVFAAFDYDWPPITPHWEAQQAYHRFMTGIRVLEQQHPVLDGLVDFDKAGHLARMQASGQFRFTREFMLHNIDEGSAERLVGLALSQGSVQSLLKLGLTRAQIGVDLLQQELNNLMGSATERWYWTSRVRVGVV